jgi:hypothetical protein
MDSYFNHVIKNTFKSSVVLTLVGIYLLLSFQKENIANLKDDNYEPFYSPSTRLLDLEQGYNKPTGPL